MVGGSKTRNELRRSGYLTRQEQLLSLKDTLFTHIVFQTHMKNIDVIFCADSSKNNQPI